MPRKSKPARPHLHRPTRKRILAGVAAGLADFAHLSVDLIRLLFVLLTMIGGIGLVLYLLLWLLLPEN